MEVAENALTTNKQQHGAYLDRLQYLYDNPEGWQSHTSTDKNYDTSEPWYGTVHTDDHVNPHDLSEAPVLDQDGWEEYHKTAYEWPRGPSSAPAAESQLRKSSRDNVKSSSVTLDIEAIIPLRRRSTKNVTNDSSPYSFGKQARVFSRRVPAQRKDRLHSNGVEVQIIPPREQNKTPWWAPHAVAAAAKATNRTAVLPLAAFKVGGVASFTATKGHPSTQGRAAITEGASGASGLHLEPLKSPVRATVDYVSALRADVRGDHAVVNSVAVPVVESFQVQKKTSPNGKAQQSTIKKTEGENRISQQQLQLARNIQQQAQDVVAKVEQTTDCLRENLALKNQIAELCAAIQKFSQSPVESHPYNQLIDEQAFPLQEANRRANVYEHHSSASRRPATRRSSSYRSCSRDSLRDLQPVPQGVLQSRAATMSSESFRLPEPLLGSQSPSNAATLPPSAVRGSTPRLSSPREERIVRDRELLFMAKSHVHRLERLAQELNIH